LIEHADCVLPADNGALASICTRAAKAGRPATGSAYGASGAPTVANGGDPHAKLRAFDEMNNVVGGLLANLTASMRFDGLLNVDLNEITTNLVPFPRMHFLLPAMAPLAMPRSAPSSSASIDAMFTEAFSKEALLLDVRRSATAIRPRCLAAAALVRGDVAISDVSRNLARLGPGLEMAHWNEAGFKVGLCRVPPAHQPRSLLCLFNSTAIGGVIDEHRSRFDRLYTRRAHLHHYTKYIEQEHVDSARANVMELIAEYNAVQSAHAPKAVEQPLGRAIPLR